LWCRPCEKYISYFGFGDIRLQAELAKGEVGEGKDTYAEPGGELEGGAVLRKRVAPWCILYLERGWKDEGGEGWEL